MAPPNNRKRSASLPSPSKSKRLATATATSGQKKSVPPLKKAGTTKSLSSLGFSSSKRPSVQIGTKILLNDSIYGGKCPEGVRKHMFVYEVVELHPNGRTVKVQYNNQVVRQGGDKYRVYKEGDDVQVRCFRISFFCIEISNLPFLFVVYI
jgi:hypothetical protein